MARKRHTAEEIVTKLRQVDVLVSQGRPIAEAWSTLSPQRADSARTSFCM